MPEPTPLSPSGYDAVALGNHDFDAGVPALKRMLTKVQELAQARGQASGASESTHKAPMPLPAVLCSNLDDIDALPGVSPFIVKEYDLGPDDPVR